MSKTKTAGKTATAMGSRAPRTTDARLAYEAVAEEQDTWEFLEKFFPDAVKALHEYAFMYDLCVPYVFNTPDRKEPRTLARAIGRACLRATGGKALTLDFCWREEPVMFETGLLPGDLWEALSYMRRDAPKSYAIIERLDKMLPTVLGFPKCPRLLSPAVLVRACVDAIGKGAVAA